MEGAADFLDTTADQCKPPAAVTTIFARAREDAEFSTCFS
jgi:hypothetical protein